MISSLTAAKLPTVQLRLNLGRLAPGAALEAARRCWEQAVSERDFILHRNCKWGGFLRNEAEARNLSPTWLACASQHHVLTTVQKAGEEHSSAMTFLFWAVFPQGSQIPFEVNKNTLSTTFCIRKKKLCVNLPVQSLFMIQGTDSSGYQNAKGYVCGHNGVLSLTWILDISTSLEIRCELTNPLLTVISQSTGERLPWKPSLIIPSFSRKTCQHP